MNEWVKKIRSSVQSVVDGKRRKSSAPSAPDTKLTAAAGRPHTVATVDELPPAEGPQLPGLTKQRARGPPRRRPSPRPSQQSSDRTVSCPPPDSDPARFAWGRDPSIDPALFFSDVVRRSMVGTQPTNGSPWAAERLGSIVEGEGGEAGETGEEREEKVEGAEGAPERAEGSERVSESSDRLSGGSQRVSGGSEEEVKGEEGEPEAAEGLPGAAEGLSEAADGLSGDAEAVSGDAEAVSGDAEAVSGDAEAVSGDAVETVRKAETAEGTERPANGASEGRVSPVLHLTGGEVEGTPRRRLCAIL